MLLTAFCTRTRFCRSLMRSTARSKSNSRPCLAGRGDQRLHVLGKAASAVADTREEEGVADALVAAHALADRRPRPRPPSRTGRRSSFMKEMRVASMALAAYLVSSAERVSMKRMGCSRAHEGGVELAHDRRGRARVAAPMTTRSGLQEVVDGGALPSGTRGCDTTSKGWLVTRAISSAPCRPCPPGRCSCRR